MNKFKNIILIIFFFIIGSTYGSTVYVAKTGNDNNNGSINTPFLTIKRAVRTINAGDIIIIKEGVYNEYIQFLNLPKPITYKNYQTDMVTIYDESAVGLLNQAVEKNYATVIGITITGLDFRLQPGSPAINAGVNVGLTTDFLGNPIVGLPDIGAIEYQAPTIIYYNISISGTATKNNCGAGFIGSTVTYTVPANKHSSTISQSDANNKAITDLNTNKQFYANTNGTCTMIVYYNTAISGTATKNNCGFGLVGSTVTYTVPENKHSSTTSQSDADNKAITDLNTNKQEYANTNGTCIGIPVYYNIKRNSTVTKNNCAPGYKGSSVTYIVPAGKYSSMISQVDANDKAWAEVLANRQTYANTNGTCIFTGIYYNIKRNSTIAKNDCSVGYKGSLVTYVVPAGKYNSTISQEDANNKAWAEVLANRQSYANTNGTCTFVGYYNIKRNSTVTKNNCAPGYKGSSVTYVVPAGKYNSMVSQEDANNKAWVEVLANRQTYANTNGTCIFTGIYYNIKRNSTVVKNNCPVGYVGSSVTYVVPAGKYSSTISQEDANNKAWTEVLANRQTYANTNGTCIPK